MRGKRAKLPLIEDNIQIPNIPPLKISNNYNDTKSLELKDWQISDIINFTICTIEDDKNIAQWENPKYLLKKIQKRKKT